MEDIDKAFSGDVRGAVVNYLRKFAEITGIDVVFYASQKVGDEWVGPVIKDGGLTVDLRNSDGGFCWDNNKIYIDINAGAHNNLSAKEVLHNTMLYTFGHEFVHFCEKWNAEEYLQFRQFVFQYMDEKMARDAAAGNTEHRNMEELIRARMEHEGRDYDYCAREVLADALAKILPDSNFAQELAQENMTWVEQIIDMLKKFIADIKAALNGIDPVENAPHVDIRENIGGSMQYLEVIRQMYDKLAAGAVQNYQAAMETEAQKNTTREGSVSRKARMTDAEIQAVQSIGRISVNQFSSADIKATERFAQQYWKEMGVKSPFFRAWFGDWRANDQTKVQVATQKGDARGVQKNTDTGWDIQVSGKVFNETKVHIEPYNKAARPYLPYINDIVKKAVLLDSSGIDVGRAKSNNSLLMHSLYAVADIGNGLEIIKLYVEEMNNPNAENTSKRAYQLQNIEKYHFATKSSQNTASSRSVASGTVDTVADLFAAVKQKDESFQPNPASKVVNADGTPMVVYHGTSDQFTEFKHSELSDKEGSFFFAQNREDAEAYTGNGNVMAVYVNLQNPIDYNDMPSDIYKLKDKKAQVAALRKLRYDGWMCDMDTGWGEVSAFNSNQIKSATDNIGTFDGSNADIRYKRRASVQADQNSAVAKAGEKAKNDTAVLEKRKPKKYNKRSRYSETETLFMSWENGSAPVGERKSFYRFGKIHFYEKTEIGCVELSRAQYSERNDLNVEKDYRRSASGIRKTADSDGGPKRGLLDDYDRNRDTGTAEAVSRQAIGEKLRDDAGRGVSSGRGVAVESEIETKVSGKKRGTTLSDREVLEVAALRMDTSTLTEGEQTALQIFKDRLAEMRKLQIERERLGSLWHEQQFGSGDRSEAPKTLNRMQVLDGQIERAVNSVLSVEDKQILRDVLQKARQYVKEQSVDHYRGILERRKDRSTQTQLRQKLHSTVHELSQLLLHGDKTHHVPESMKKAVAGALDVIKI